MTEGAGLVAWLEEGQGHGGFLKLYGKNTTSPENKVTPGTWEPVAVGRSVGHKKREVRTKADLRISAYRGFGVLARWLHWTL